MAVQDISTYSFKHIFSLSAVQFEKACVFNKPEQVDAYSVYWIKQGKGKTCAAHHIKEADVTKAVATNIKESTNKVTLAKGKYVYFCPLNPTPQNTLIVKQVFILF